MTTAEMEATKMIFDTEKRYWITGRMPKGVKYASV
jgi:hypothetical protein